MRASSEPVGHVGKKLAILEWFAGNHCSVLYKWKPVVLQQHILGLHFLELLSHFVQWIMTSLVQWGLIATLGMLMVWENILFLYVNASVCKSAVPWIWSLVWPYIFTHTVMNIWWACDWNVVVPRFWTRPNSKLSHMNPCYIEIRHHLLAVTSNFYF